MHRLERTAARMSKPPNEPLPNGYSLVPPGRIATVVTYLEMTRRPSRHILAQVQPAFHLRRIDGASLDAYRACFRRVGEDWLWFSRLVMPDEELRRILDDPSVTALILRQGKRSIGLLELDFRQAGECEIAFLGLAAEAIGRGLGRMLMDRALVLAWAKPIRRLWIHTCGFDHPTALGFYRRCGFRPYASAVEVLDDPRLTGLIARERAPHVPLIEPGGYLNR
jgi:GNAT superfamily N-acetyltransferase